MQKEKLNETKLVVISRADITPGYVAVQSCHAIADFAYEFPDKFKDWKAESNSIICLAVKDEEGLLKLFEKFSKLTSCSKFYEPDVDAYTAICLYGTSDIRKKLSHLPLVLKPKKEDSKEEFNSIKN